MHDARTSVRAFFSSSPRMDRGVRPRKGVGNCFAGQAWKACPMDSRVE